MIWTFGSCLPVQKNTHLEGNAEPCGGLEFLVPGVHTCEDVHVQEVAEAGQICRFLMENGIL